MTSPFSLWILVLVSSTTLMAQQPLSLEECQTKARQHYPLIRKLGLIEKTASFTTDNVSKMFLPQLNITGQASYQSQTISFSDALGSLPLPTGISLPSVSKDQYRLQAELTQLLYDGGNAAHQRAIIRANQDVQTQSIEVALFALRDRVNQLFFSILLMDEQLKLNEIRKSDLMGTAGKLEAALRFGTAFRSNLDQVKAELINTDMAAIELRTGRTAYSAVLSALIGQDLPDHVVLTLPVVPIQNQNIARPELKLFELQRLLLTAEERRLKTDVLPKISAFAQGAYGRPTLNIVENKFGPWWILGARMNWNLSSLYTLKNNQQNISINREVVQSDQETFLLNTTLSLLQQNGEMIKYTLLIEEDRKAIDLRASIKKAAQAQLDNGIITTHDYITQLNSEHMARQMLAVHQMQLLQAGFKYNETTGAQ
jgi:outer membrane protein